ncbi:uncharacterized protein LOC119907981 isoform X1 [Micropterus salmoides]|uniref:uncharacterized protein LOC119907981 isoform X1 n=1 Tax=Micropterus salmoides TaxID=27706 RepID=UPI0018ED3F54|nr:uncharacterized protein LOC119907981 isoform X1 [Micropterus salmoides]
MRKTVNICSCLLVFVLGCNVTAAINNAVVEEKSQITLPCPHPAEGKVTWSRERNGNRVDILIIDGDGEIRHNDPDRRYNSVADKFKSLFINRVNLSDTGRYLCNNEPAVELTVIKPGETARLTVVERTNITLNCPSAVSGLRDPTWTRENCGTNITVSSQNEMDKHARYSTTEETLTITDVQPDDAGLYYCDGKPVVHLNVTKDEQSEKAVVLVLGIFLPLLFIILIILFLIWRCRIKRRGSGEQKVEVVYAEITDGLVVEPQDGSKQLDVTYSVIQGLPTGNKTVASRPNESPYSLIKLAWSSENMKVTDE